MRALRHIEPLMQMRLVRHQLLHFGVGAENVLGVARQRRPAEWADAAAEQRTDIGRHEAGKIERVLDACFLRHLADVVAVVEGRHAGAPECEHGAHVRRHRLLRRPLDAFRIVGAARVPFRQRPARGQIAVDRIMRRGLIGHRVGPDAAPHQFGQHLGGVAEQADRDRFSLAAGAIHHRQRFVEVLCLRVEIAGLEPHLDARRLALDRQQRRTRHGGGERLRAAHAAEPGGEDPFARKAAAVVAPHQFGEGLVGALHDAL